MSGFSVRSLLSPAQTRLHREESGAGQSIELVLLLAVGLLILAAILQMMLTPDGVVDGVRANLVALINGENFGGDGDTGSGDIGGEPGDGNLPWLPGDPGIGGDPGSPGARKQGEVQLTPIAKPDPSLPDVWDQPDGTKMDGKCGITAVSNMLRFYGIKKDPKDIDKPEYRSWGPGLRRDKLAEDLESLSDKGFSSKNIEDDDPLEVLRGHIRSGKPVAIQYMTHYETSTEAHWVVVVDISDGEDPYLTVQSGGRYQKVRWSDIKDPWRRGYGGPYPYVVGNDPSEILLKAQD